MPDRLPDVRVYDTRTSEKLPNPVPRVWLELYPHLKEQPSTRTAPKPAVTRRRTTTTESAASAATPTED